VCVLSILLGVLACQIWRWTFAIIDGYGKLNAGKFVELAQSWKLVKPQAWVETDVQSVVTPENGAGQFITPEGVSHTYSVTADALKAANLERLEHVTVQVWIDHARRGDVEVELTSPKGVVSVLARTRRNDEATTGFRGWKFMSMKHWYARPVALAATHSLPTRLTLVTPGFHREEDPTGDWTLKVIDRINPLKNGTFQAWSLQLWGEAIDASKAVPYALPVVEDDNETGDSEGATVSASATEASAEPTATTDAATKVLPKPTANLPSDHAAAPGHSAKPGLADPVLPTDAITSAAAGPIGSQATPDEGTFDGIERLQSSTWVYGALGFIALAGLSGAAFFYLRSRRRRGSFGAGDERGQYGVLGASDEGLSMGILGRSKQRRDGAKASELYDAFGDGTDSENDLDGADEGRGLEYHECVQAALSLAIWVTVLMMPLSSCAMRSSFLDDDDHSPRPST
jgi:kexin